MRVFEKTPEAEMLNPQSMGPGGRNPRVWWVSSSILKRSLTMHARWTYQHTKRMRSSLLHSHQTTSDIAA